MARATRTQSKNGPAAAAEVLAGPGGGRGRVRMGFKESSSSLLGEITQAVASLVNVPVRAKRFWVSQIMVIIALIVTSGMEIARFERIDGFSSAIALLLYMVPVAYAGASFGMVGSLGVALEALLFTVPAMIILPPRLLPTSGATAVLATAVAVAIILGRAYDSQIRMHEEMVQSEIERVAHYLEGHPLSWSRLIDLIPDGVLILREDGTIRAASSGLLALIGRSASELLDTPSAALFRQVHDHQHIIGASGEIPVEVEAVPFHHSENLLELVIVRDLRPKLAAWAELEIEQERFKTIFEFSMAGMFLVDDNDLILAANPAFCNMVGYSEEDLVGTTSASITQADDERISDENRARLLAGEASAVRYEKRYIHRDGHEVYVEVSKSIYRNAGNDVKYLIASVRDITEERSLAELLAYQATHDPVCGIPNRWALMNLLQQSLATSRRNGHAVALTFLDLDDFKPINDRYGHQAGDQLLRTFAKRLQETVRESDLVARLGGDEFVVVATELGDGDPHDAVTSLMNRMIDVVSEPFDIGDDQVHVGMSAGVAYFPFDAEDADSLLREADAALYQAKMRKHRRDRWWMFRSDTDDLSNGGSVAIDPFGNQATTLLERHRELLAREAERLTYLHCSLLRAEPAIAEVLAPLSEAEQTEIERREVAAIATVLAPESRLEEVNRAAGIGVDHALIGITTATILERSMAFQNDLAKRLAAASLPASDVHRLTSISEQRMQLFAKEQIARMDETVQAYFASVSEALPFAGAPWSDEAAKAIERFGNLAGIRAALVARPNTDGVFVVEHASGEVGELVKNLLNSPGHEIVLDEASPRGHGVGAEAWRSQRIMSNPTLYRNDNHAAWVEQIIAWGVASAAAVPIQNSMGQPVALIVLYGAQPNQFEAPWVKLYLHRVQQNWEVIWTRTSSAARVISRDEAVIHRQRLFSGGLEMYLQPIIELATGRVAKVEALARLRMGAGRVVTPGDFLPALGQSELDRLFRIGLNQALASLEALRPYNPNLQLSINLSPATLTAPELVSWVKSALDIEEFPPSNLVLEILETDALTIDLARRNIKQLSDIGVHLALDDMGTGYSNWQRLVQLPVAILKVDQSLLADLESDPIRTLGLIGGILEVGRETSREVVIEGLEKPAMIEAAYFLGARYGQGYAFARPQAPRSIVRWMANFKLPFEPGIATSALGALAYHRRVTQTEGRHPGDIDSCPMSGYFESSGLATTEVVNWHRRLHTKRLSNSGYSEQLSSWLELLVRTKGLVLRA